MTNSLKHIEQMLAQATKKGDSIAVYCFPDTGKIEAISGEIKLLPLSEVDSSAFIVGPFDSKGHAYCIFGENIAISSSKENISFYQQELSEEVSKIGSNYENLVKKGISSIQSGIFEKVVLSRQELVHLKDTFSALHFFFHLCKEYPGLFISLVSSPQFGTWIGASPELLLSCNEDEVQTMSLAGTLIKEYKGEMLVAGEKEINEQAVVTKYIREVFSNLRMCFKEKEEGLVSSSNLYHLRTIFTATKDRKITVAEILNHLHPTPAICGYPREKALQFILEEENYDRQLFGGFLGVVRDQHNALLYVNLRCMQLFGDRAILYAGAGIMGDSDPYKEWLETEKKMDTLRLQLKEYE